MTTVDTKLDDVDREIIDELEKDSRVTPTVISRRLEVPRTTVKARIDRMIDAGFIKGFSMKKDFSKFGLPTTAFILVSYDSSSGIPENEVGKSLKNIPNVEEVHIISGEYDILVKIRGKSIEDVGDAVVDRMHAVRGVSRTLTVTSFREIK